ncbi:hypothetical protein BATDEDRAFT_36999 [Batrachochytrium dendrobatidis JAM81]|uniref:AB hydrolase-1 domain-containing protein n=1 Tax=Batrachochytrium dendrobatidis (strain JAM81 / FGSC 10211) TaxID=684364 RepID=F4P4T7_BATDJ|nr:uncharacterized protein BATDEDRAFT_36999 [Batrachochytrium dendrobatidis JAM81]EGF79851.1 hypothetical protein BATDEDRAFT_36999 [Batrachochytrium dendrobatidis JAM81]KAJ8329318.1 hypothetical protein O5D80_002534 [Batrachochytrium dendrobatidis]KAK5673593.1 hypothetical protein QVD99_001031 [Batrachochytrium dendrobatidis]|eukprot:XP_006679590.1 hypothetical protein BATDEDRAFT_36999 [Batrachochytrium dendrobatidis JAM81]
MPKLTVHTFGTAPVDIYYETYGSGLHHVLFVNGMSSIAHLWDLQIEYFLQFPEYSLCIFDNRGSGFSSSPIGRYTTSMMAKDTFELIRHLGWLDSVHIVALSMGGMIAQELALMLGDAVKSLCLVSTYCKPTGILIQPPSFKEMLQFITPKYPTLESYAEMTVCMLFPETWLNSPCIRDISHVTNRSYAVKYFLDRLAVTGFQTAVGRTAQHAAVLSHFFDERLSQLSKHTYPILVMAGDQDQIVRQPTSSEYLAERLNARMKIYFGGGHALRLQDPEWHNKHVHENIKLGIKAQIDESTNR